MSLRLTKAGVVMLVALALLLSVGVFRLVVGGDEPVFLDIPQVRQAGSATSLEALNPALIYQQRAAGVVTLSSVFPGGTVSGSGFLVDTDGHIVTNAHVVTDVASRKTADAVFVEFQGGDRVSGEVLGVDHFSDIAVVKVNPDKVEGKLRPVPLGNSDQVIVGEPVVAIGSPFGNSGSISKGIVSAAHRSIDSVISSYNIADAIQTDAAINRGNSGGPLFNARGRVIGINAQIRSTNGQSQGVGFAIPINGVKRSLRQIVETGAVRYAYMGVQSKTVTPQLAHEFDLPTASGALVQWVRPGGPADDAGLRPGREVLFQGQRVKIGDQIVSIAGVKVRSEDDVTRVVSRLDVGDMVEIEFYRDGKRQVERVSTTERPLA